MTYISATPREAAAAPAVGPPTTLDDRTTWHSVCSLAAATRGNVFAVAWDHTPDAAGTMYEARVRLFDRGGKQVGSDVVLRNALNPALASDGTEFIVAYAFLDKPAGFEPSTRHLVARRIHADGTMDLPVTVAADTPSWAFPALAFDGTKWRAAWSIQGAEGTHVAALSPNGAPIATSAFKIPLTVASLDCQGTTCLVSSFDSVWRWRMENPSQESVFKAPRAFQAVYTRGDGWATLGARSEACLAAGKGPACVDDLRAANISASGAPVFAAERVVVDTAGEPLTYYFAGTSVGGVELATWPTKTSLSGAVIPASSPPFVIDPRPPADIRYDRQRLLALDDRTVVVAYGTQRATLANQDPATLAFRIITLDAPVAPDGGAGADGGGQAADAGDGGTDTGFSTASSSSGCGCLVVGVPHVGGSSGGLVLVALALLRRQRRAPTSAEG